MKGTKRDLVLKAKELELELEFINRSRKQDADEVRLEEQNKVLDMKIENATLKTESKTLKNPYNELKEILTTIVDKIATIEIKGLNLPLEKRED